MEIKLLQIVTKSVKIIIKVSIKNYNNKLN